MQNAKKSYRKDDFHVEYVKNQWFKSLLNCRKPFYVPVSELTGYKFQIP